MKRQVLIAVLGPTASGKSAFALQLALQLGGEILCMDSTTIYRGFDIGTAKPNERDRAIVKHHLIDILDPLEPFSAFHFVQFAEQTIQEVFSRGKVPIIVGGTYFYLRALQHGMYPVPVVSNDVVEALETEYFEDDTLNTARMHSALKEHDPESAARIHPNDRYRLLRALAIFKTTGKRPSELQPIPRTPEQSSTLWTKYAMAVSRGALTQSIVLRTENMLRQGLVEETRKLMERYPSSRALQSIGYSEAVQFLQKKITEKQLRNEIIEKTRQLAKRQITWLRSDSEIRYIDTRDVDRVVLEQQNLAVAIGQSPAENSCAQ